MFYTRGDSRNKIQAAIIHTDVPEIVGDDNVVETFLVYIGGNDGILRREKGNIRCLQVIGNISSFFDARNRLKFVDGDLIACIELCDPDRRLALGMPAAAEFDEKRDRPLYAFAVTWLGSRVIASVRQLLLRSGLAGGQLQVELRGLEEAEGQLLGGQDEIRRQCRDALVR